MYSSLLHSQNIGSRMRTVAQAQGNSMGGRSNRIIIPGQSPTAPKQGANAKIILPSSAQRRPPPIPNGSGNFPELNNSEQGFESAQTLSPRNFRPPTGFMNEDGPETDITLGKSTDELLATLTTKSDYWYNMARAFPRLYVEGLSAQILEEMIDVSPARQNQWLVASEVYQTVKKSGDLSKAQLAFFNSEETGPDCLLELRYLDTGRRAEGARYIADNQLGPSDSIILARAVREHERRVDCNMGFSEAGGDCLAFKYFRDAQETRNRDDLTRLVRIGVKTAVTASAREKLTELIGDFEIAEEAGPVVSLTIVRLNKDEASFRIVPLAGVYGEVTNEVLQTTSKVPSGHSFSTFIAPVANMGCVVLPRWNVIAIARHPVVLSVADASTVPEILETTGSKNPKDNAKLKAQALIVCDIEHRPAQEGSHYLVDDGGVLKIEVGSVGLKTVAKVLCVTMPPRRESLASESFEL